MRLFVPYSERVYEFACHAASCAPPPGGTGGSTPGGGRRSTSRPGSAADRRSAPRQGESAWSKEHRLANAALIQKIRTDHEAALARNRVLRAAFKKVT